jgi:hypothetical protein
VPTPVQIRCWRRCIADQLDLALLDMTPKLLISVAALAIAAASAGAATTATTAARPSVTVSVDDKRITGPARMPAGYVDIQIVTSGKVHHHLAFWHLNPGVTVKQFTHALKGSNEDPFKLGTAIGGNGPMLSGHLDATMRLVPGTVVFADIVEGPTTRIASFHVARAPISAKPPAAIGTIVNRSYRFFLPTHFGRPGIYRFTNPDAVAHDGVIYRLRAGKNASDLVRWLHAGGKGKPPVDFARPLGGPGVIGAHWTSWFRLPRLAPGRYVLGCFLPDAQGMLHAAMGMVAEFRVS